MTNTRYNIGKAPRLPAAPVEYDARYIDELTNILRLYFNQNDQLNSTLTQGTGGRFVGVPFGQWHDTTTQTAAANTITLITMNSVDNEQAATLVSNSRMTATYAGYYSLQFSAQLGNSGNQADNATIWVRQNGADLADSAGIITTPAKHGPVEGAIVSGWNQIFQLNAGDYLQFYWTTDSGNSALTTYAAGTSPTHPRSPSFAATLTFVSALPT